MSETSQKLQKKNSFTKFEFEHGGLLVYDVKGSSAQEENNQIPDPIKNSEMFTPDQLSYLKTVKNIDYYSCIELKKYPPSPVFLIDRYFKIPNDSVTLIFNSKFESGNLSKAIKMSDYEYKLFITNDIGNNKYNH